MSIKVMQWVWENSTARDAARMVLLAIADCASDDGGNAWPSVATLAQKANVSVRTVQRSIKILTEQGLIRVGSQTGPNGVNRYTINMTKGAIPSPRQPVTPDICDVSPPTSATVTPDICDKNSDRMSPVTVLEPSIEPSVEPSDARGRISTPDVIALAAFFTEAVPISNSYRVRSVIAKALGAGIKPQRVKQALTVLIEEGRGCSEDTLRIALQPAKARGRPNPAEARNDANADVIRRIAARQTQAIEGTR